MSTFFTRNFLCRFGIHPWKFREAFPPVVRVFNNNNGRPFLYIWGLRCNCCGMILREPTAPGWKENLASVK